MTKRYLMADGTIHKTESEYTPEGAVYQLDPEDRIIALMTLNAANIAAVADCRRERRWGNILNWGIERYAVARPILRAL